MPVKCVVELQARAEDLLNRVWRSDGARFWKQIARGSHCGPTHSRMMPCNAATARPRACSAGAGSPNSSHSRTVAISAGLVQTHPHGFVVAVLVAHQQRQHAAKVWLLAQHHDSTDPAWRAGAARANLTAKSARPDYGGGGVEQPGYRSGRDPPVRDDEVCRVQPDLAHQTARVQAEGLGEVNVPVEGRGAHECRHRVTFDFLPNLGHCADPLPSAHRHESETP